MFVVDDVESSEVSEPALRPSVRDLVATFFIDYCIKIPWKSRRQERLCLRCILHSSSHMDIPALDTPVRKKLFSEAWFQRNVNVALVSGNGRNFRCWMLDCTIISRCPHVTKPAVEDGFKRLSSIEERNAQPTLDLEWKLTVVLYS